MLLNEILSLRYSAEEIHFNLMAIVSSRKTIHLKDIDRLNQRKTQILDQVLLTGYADISGYKLRGSGHSPELSMGCPLGWPLIVILRYSVSLVWLVVVEVTKFSKLRGQIGDNKMYSFSCFLYLQLLNQDYSDWAFLGSSAIRGG